MTPVGAMFDEWVSGDCEVDAGSPNIDFERRTGSC